MQPAIRFLTEVDDDITRDINALLKKLNPRSNALNVLNLVDHLHHSKIAVAAHESKIVGMAILAPRYLVSHTGAGIHNLVVAEQFETEDEQLKAELLTFLLEYGKKKQFACIDIEVREKRLTRIAILKKLSFSETGRIQLRWEHRPE